MISRNNISCSTWFINSSCIIGLSLARFHAFCVEITEQFWNFFICTLALACSAGMPSAGPLRVATWTSSTQLLNEAWLARAGRLHFECTADLKLSCYNTLPIHFLQCISWMSECIILMPKDSQYFQFLDISHRNLSHSDWNFGHCLICKSRKSKF